MKNYSRKFSFPFLLVLFIGSIMFSSCKKENEKDEVLLLLQSDWIVRSHTLDGVEKLGDDFAKWEMTYEDCDNNTGNYTWNFYDVGNIISNVRSGKYSVDLENSILTIDPLRNDSLSMNMSFNGAQLILESEAYEGLYVTKADKK